MDSHGTYAAYQRHRRNHETPCDPCREANTAYARQLRNRRKTQPIAPCGTKAARQRHRRNNETCTTCDNTKTATKAAAAKKSGKTRTTPAAEPPPVKRQNVRNRDIGTTPWMYGPIPSLDPHVASQAAATVARHAPAADVPTILATLGIDQAAA